MDVIKPVIPESAWVAETAVVRGHIILGQDVSVWFGAVMRGDEAPITVGDRSNVQDGAVLHVSENHPCIIGADVTIGHRAVVHGCTVEDGVLIGMGAIVLDGAVIGAGSIIGAGAVVAPRTQVPPNTLMLGVPARPKGMVSEAQKKRGQTAVANYLKRKEQYRQGLY